MDRFDAEHKHAYPIQKEWVGKSKQLEEAVFFNINIKWWKNEVIQMKEIFEQYGSVIIAAVAISALVAIIVMLLATDGVVANSFKNLIDSFFNRAASTITG